MAKRRDRYRLLYDALCNYANGDSRFSREELASKTGYEPASIGVYIRNRLRGKYLFEGEDGCFRVENLVGVTYEQFRSYMSQKTDRHRRTFEEMLAEKSVQAFALAIENYNKPLAEYRAEAFLLLISNAWELALKAIIARLEGEPSLFYSDNPDRSLSLRDCIKKLFGEKQTPLVRNLLAIERLRDQAVHLVIPELQPTLSRLFQSSVLNYSEFLSEYEIENPIALNSQGMLNLVMNMPDADIETIRTKYGKPFSDRIVNFLSELDETEREISSADFMIPIEYRFVLSKEEKPGDISINLSKDGRPAKIVQVAKDPEISHPYRTYDLIDVVNSKLKSGETVPIGRYEIISIIHSEKVKNSKNSPMHYHMEHPDTHRYSELFADTVARKIEQHEGYVESCKRKYKESRGA